MNVEYYIVQWEILSKYIKNGRVELAFKLEDDRFLRLQNCNNKFKKHLGFTHSSIRMTPSADRIVRYESRIYIHDAEKLMLFRIKYGL